MKALKWTAIVVGGLIALIIIALLVIPMFVDINHYKPQIEQKVSDAVGRPFRVAGDISLSLFPWAGLALSDVHLGNPPGFEEKDFVSVKSFEVRVKLLPLISKEVDVQKFLLDSPSIELIKRKDGKENWQGLGKPEKAEAEKPKAPKEEKTGPLPIKSLKVDEFAISNGSVLWIDQTTGTRKEVRDFRLTLGNVSLDKPIELKLSAALDGEPVSLDGKVGPVGKEPGEGNVPVDLQVKALKQVDVKITGTIRNAASDPSFDLKLVVSPFSPRKVMAALGQSFPVATSDPEVLNALGLETEISGNTHSVRMTNGAVDLDDTKIAFSAQAKDFDKPDLAFDLKVDKINADRYLPPPGAEEPAKKEEAPPQEAGKKPDYEPLRRMVLDGSIAIGHLQVKGAKIQDVEMKVTGKNGLFQLDPLAMNLYQGHVAGKGAFDVQSDTPKSSATLNAKDIQVNPLLQDVARKDVLEGTLVADLAVNMQGTEPQRIKKTLDGKGALVFKDGAIKGIDLTALAQKLKAAAGLAQANEAIARTDFSELSVPFTITDGVVQTSDTKMVTPLTRMEVTGKADLVQETLDFRIEPKLVATLKGQGDTGEHSGVLVPILVTGTFASPRFLPDVKAVAKEQLEKKADELLKGKEGEKAKEKVEDLLKKLPLGK